MRTLSVCTSTVIFQITTVPLFYYYKYKYRYQVQYKYCSKLLVSRVLLYNTSTELPSTVYTVLAELARIVTKRTVAKPSLQYRKHKYIII